MLFRSVWASVLILPLFALGVQAQTYKIKIKEQGDVGKSVATHLTEKSKQTVKVSFMGQVAKQQEREEAKEEIYTTVVLENGGDNPKKLKKTYTKAVTTAENQETP